MHSRSSDRTRAGRWLRAAACALLLAAWAGRAAAAPEQPLFRFGVVADVQHADKPTAGLRRYADSLGLLKACVEDLNRQDLAFVLQLGDLVDGNGAKTADELERVVALFRTLKAPVRHAIGNHCLTVPRPTLMKATGQEKPYYAFDLPGWRFVVLDGMDVSTMGPASDEGKRLAAEYTAKDPKLRRYNGAVGPAQMAWLREQLAQGAREKRRVVVCCHHPALAAAAAASATLWNGAEVVQTLEDAGGVVAYLSGHEHRGGYALQKGIHHLTLQGMIEAPEGKTAYAVIDVFADRLQVRGFGTVPERTLRY